MSFSFQLPSIEPPIILSTQGYLTDNHLNCDMFLFDLKLFFLTKLISKHIVEARSSWNGTNREQCNLFLMRNMVEIIRKNILDHNFLFI